MPQIPHIDLPGHEGRFGYYQHVASGKRFFPCDPRPEEVNITDIAHALSQQCRFGGHTAKFYSVAEHSVHVSRVVHPAYAKEGLLHDAAEAYIGDMIRPLKLLKFLGGPYRFVEERLERAIAARFFLHYPWAASVRAADEAVCTAEMAQIIANPDKGHLHDATEEAVIKVQCWPPVTAERHFLERFDELFGNGE